MSAENTEDNFDPLNPDHRHMQARNITVGLIKGYTSRIEQELEFLIMATPTGERRNLITDINIRVGNVILLLNRLDNEKEPS
jgi:hypothetical protein